MTRSLESPAVLPVANTTNWKQFRFIQFSGCFINLFL